MILTCPNCASRYTVPDDRIGPHGRAVRCAGCGETWRAMRAETEPPLDLTPVSPDPKPEPAKPKAAELPKKFRAKTQAKQRTREAAVAGAVWGALGALVVGLIVCAALFRVEMVRLWPRTAGAYAMVGLTVNPTGLAPENVVAAPGLKNGQAAVIVTGQIRNVETRPQEPQPLKVSLLDKQGKALVVQVAHLPQGALAPGQTRSFSLAFLDPPAASADVQVEFALNEKPRAEAKARQLADAHAPKLRGAHEPELPPMPEAKMAEPLPTDSQFALPPAAANGHGPAPAAHAPEHH